jgi:thiol-disulfide isomerase/thioredoxin
LTEQFDTRLRLDQSSSAGTVSRQQQQQQQQQQDSTASATPTVPPNTKPSWLDGRKTKKKNSDSDDKSDDGNDSSQKDDDESDDDDEFDYLLDDNNGDDEAVLQAIRQKRLRELVKAQSKEAEHKSKGHGEVRTISQDEFLSECTSSRFVVVHFFHNEFEKCKIMDHHLKKIAINPQHLSCKFVRIDAEKAPFFVVKLQIKALPTVLVFRDGQTIERLLGFEGLTESSNVRRANDIIEFPTSRLGYWLESVGAIEYDGPESDDEDANNKSRRSTPHGINRTQVYDEDF